MDLVRESNEYDDDSLQSWYGAPQHEVGSRSSWEGEYYGEPSDRDDSRSVEFVPGIEYRIDTASEEPAAAGRAVPSLSASD